MTKLTTERLMLRPYRIEDAADMHEKFGEDEEMYRYSGWNPYASVQEAENFIRRELSESGSRVYPWVIERDGVIVGNTAAYEYDEEKNSIEVGLSIEKPSWGKGYASEALKAVLAYLTETEGIGSITAWCAADNIGSKRAMEKAGMVPESIEKDGLKIGDAVFDKLNYVYRSKGA